MNQYQLPDGWRWVKLGELLEFQQYGISQKSNWEKKGHPILGMGNIKGGKLDLSDLKYAEVPKLGSDKYTLRKGDILINRTNSAELVGKSAVFDLEGDYVFASYLIRLRARELEADPYFINFAINSFIGRDYVSRVARRAIGQANINSREISEMPIPICSISEQRRIAARIQELMQEVDRTRVGCEKQLEAAKALPAAYLCSVFESKEAKRWERKKLGYVSTIIMGQSPPSSTYNSDNLGLPFFQGKVDFGSVYPVARVWCSKPIKISRANDILISVRAPVGPTNMADKQCCIGRGLAAIRAHKDIEPWFILFFFRSIEKDFLSTYGARGSTFGAMNRQHLHNLELPVPPFLEQQSITARIREFMKEADKTKETCEEQLMTANAIPQGLLRRMFRGEL